MGLNLRSVTFTIQINIAPLNPEIKKPVQSQKCYTTFSILPNMAGRFPPAEKRGYCCFVQKAALHQCEHSKHLASFSGSAVSNLFSFLQQSNICSSSVINLWLRSNKWLFGPSTMTVLTVFKYSKQNDSKSNSSFFFLSVSLYIWLVTMCFFMSFSHKYPNPLEGNVSILL